MTVDSKESLEDAARWICSTLSASGFRALLAGGCVRDLLLGVPAKDFDVVTSARPEEVVALFPKTVTVGAAFGVVMVLLPAGTVEVATFRTDGPYMDGRHPSEVFFSDEEQDAKRRDFTVNAMFLNPVTDEIIDYVGGREDIRSGILRTVGDPESRFQEDRLRMLRAVRFAARLGFELDDKTRAGIVNKAAVLGESVSVERIRDELIKMLTEGAARRAFELLDETGLLSVVLPEIVAMKGVEQPPEFHPEGDVFQHTLEILNQLPAGCSLALAMGALLHDVGKPLTQTHEDRIRFSFHEKVGACMAREIAERFKFSNQDTEKIVWLVEQHMRVAAIPQMREGRRRMFVTEAGFQDMLALSRMDCLASHNDLEIVRWIENYVSQLPPGQERPKLLINGDDLISAGYKPGKSFSEILNAIRDAQYEGILTSRDEALDFVLSRWERH